MTMRPIQPLIALTLCACSLAAEQRMTAIHVLKLPRLAGGSLPTYYSPGGEERARRLQEFVQGERAFYRAQLGVALDGLVLAVLSPPHWDAVSAPVPYGMPSVEGQPPVIAMPSDWDLVTAMPLPSQVDATADLRKQAQATGKTWRELMHTGADGIAAHELGHAIVRDYGIDAQTHWFNEFLASYVGDVYVVQKRPQDVAANRLLWAACLEWPHPHTTLAYFDTHYDELMQKNPRNYGWYQCAMDQRVIEVHAREGLGFLVRVKAAFPKDGPKLTSEQVLDRLQAMDPGWRAWAEKLKTD